jgi:hypothetical protein
MSYGTLGSQPMRPEAERSMPDWERDALDRRRMERANRRAGNPELYAQLDRIETKLDALLIVSRETSEPK